MKREDWTVGAEGVRPAGQPDRCFYCREKVGSQHAPGCVIRSRTVVVRTIIEHVMTVPEDWEISTIEFTDGSWCADNFAEDLADIVERLDKVGKCLCGSLTREYVREATAADEERDELRIANKPS